MKSESIFTLYSDEKYDRILLYLIEHHIFTLSDLRVFNFDRLLTVPGISVELAKEAKQVFEANWRPTIDSNMAASLAAKLIAMLEAENLNDGYTTRFIDDPNKSDSDDLHCSNSVNDLPLSTKARNALISLGISSCDEFLVLERLIRTNHLETSHFPKISKIRELLSIQHDDPSKLYYFKDIDSKNALIPISLLHNAGLSYEEIHLLQENNLFTVGDLCERGLTAQEYIAIYDLGIFLSLPVTQHFINNVEILKDRTKTILSMRCTGATLEQIGKEFQLTRERVRQILAETYSKLINFAELVAGMLLSTDRTFFYFADLVDLFHSEELATLCKLVLQESSFLRYFKFSDGFVRSSACDADVDDRLNAFAEEVIGESGINYYDNLELIESELKKRNLDFFNTSDMMNFLIHNNYRFYGNYVAGKRFRYSMVCHDAVLKYFPFDIKLDANQNNEDMRRLRQIISKHYRGLSLPLKNRALTAGMTHDASNLILSGRGRYCPIEKVNYSIALFEDICNFIHSSPQPTFYYDELFSLFKERLLKETNIDNRYLLHGVLKYLYSNEFVFEKDMLSKLGEPRQNVDDRLSQLLLENGRAMTKNEIKQSIPGINDHVIAFSVRRKPELLQWDYNEFNHIDNITITGDEREILSNAVKTQTDLHSGYASDTLLFAAVKDTCKDFLQRNNIANSQNLYYVASKLFGDDYRFRRPHILAKDFPVQDISSVNIVQVLLRCETDLNFEKFLNLADTLGWSMGTRYSLFSELAKDYIRVSENDYVRKTHFNMSPSALNIVSDTLQRLVSKSGYVALGSIVDYGSFPACSYRWNGFLLESLIIEYDTGCRIISPQILDRRTLKGIIVPEDSPYQTFEDLVLGNLLADGISTLTETELLEYLKMHNLIVTNTIPQELYECPKLRFKDEIFTTQKHSQNHVE